METKYIQNPIASLPPGTLSAVLVPVPGSPGLYEVRYSAAAPLPQGDYVPVVTLEDNAVVATPVIARYTDYGDTVDVRLRVEYEADAGAGGMSFLVSTPVGSAAASAIATFNGSNGGGVNYIQARGQGANILIEITIIPDSTGDFDCVINYKKA